MAGRQPEQRGAAKPCLRRESGAKGRSTVSANQSVNATGPASTAARIARTFTFAKQVLQEAAIAGQPALSRSTGIASVVTAAGLAKIGSGHTLWNQHFKDTRHGLGTARAVSAATRIAGLNRCRQQQQHPAATDRPENVASVRQSWQHFRGPPLRQTGTTNGQVEYRPAGIPALANSAAPAVPVESVRPGTTRRGSRGGWGSRAAGAAWCPAMALKFDS
jgi:hypothetical protein